MEVQTETHSQYFVLRLSGDLRFWTLGDRGAHFREQLEAALASEELQRIVLNLKGVTQIDSLAIAALARVPMTCLQRSIDIKIVLPAGVPGESLRNVGIFWAWKVFDDEPAAAEACLAAVQPPV